MKRYIYSIIAAAAVCTGCSDDFLNRTPSNSITTDEAIESLADANTANEGLYSLMASDYYYNSAMFLYGDMKGDDMISIYWASGRLCHLFYTYEHSAGVPNNGGLWGRPYYIVRNAWNIVRAIDQGKVSGDKAMVNDLRGQALAVIALCHFDLTRCFGYPYAKDGGKSWGVPVVDHNIGFDEHPDRSTVAQDYEFIINTLKEAIPLLSSAKNNGHINSFAARALLARVYLYCEKNKEAFETADALIKDCAASNKYFLTPNAAYAQQFALDNKFGNEALFQVANTPTYNSGRESLSFMAHWWGYAAIEATQAFKREVLDRNPYDVRQKVFKTYQDSGDKLYYTFMLKYPGTAESEPSYNNNYTVLRLSEVYLIAAEAAVKGGGDKAAGLAYLNAIVQRGNPENSVADADYNLDRVLYERRFELIGEGHRFFDLLRNGRTIHRTGDRHYAKGAEEINWDSYNCILPIHRDQFIFNPDMPQNPGYTKN